MTLIRTKRLIRSRGFKQREKMYVGKCLPQISDISFSISKTDIKLTLNLQFLWPFRMVSWPFKVSVCRKYQALVFISLKLTLNLLLIYSFVDHLGWYLDHSWFFSPTTFFVSFHLIAFCEEVGRCTAKLIWFFSFSFSFLLDLFPYLIIFPSG